jgi:hypothetical protein
MRVRASLDSKYIGLTNIPIFSTIPLPILLSTSRHILRPNSSLRSSRAQLMLSARTRMQCDPAALRCAGVLDGVRVRMAVWVW